MNPISFTSVNLVTQESSWHMRDWAPAEEAANRAFAPLDGYRARIEEIAAWTAGAGFEHIDLWLAHVNPRWATEEHLAVLDEVLSAHGLTVLALSGSMGGDLAELAAVRDLAARLGARALAGPCPAFESDPLGAIDVMRGSDVVLALENHPLESAPQHMLDKLAGQDVVRTTIDTGWWATMGADPLDAIDRLVDVASCLHLKDVRITDHHDNVPWGEGVVPVRACLERALERGYRGPITIEYEPDDGDPRPAVATMKAQLDAWTASAAR